MVLTVRHGRHERRVVGGWGRVARAVVAGVLHLDAAHGRSHAIGAVYDRSCNTSKGSTAHWTTPTRLVVIHNYLFPLPSG